MAAARRKARSPTTAGSAAHPESGSRTEARKNYNEKRDFTQTPEPAPGPVRGGRNSAPVFVVQKHEARRLHWDFRLEHDGALWSWAVPKGPSMDPGDKRLAVHVEDHPLDYAQFSGTIPEGNYGAGTVEIWDHGTWRPLDGFEPGKALAKGELKFLLDGRKLNGAFVLVRMKPRPAKGDRKDADNWLLIKERGPDAQAGLDADAMDKTGTAPSPARTQTDAPAKRPRVSAARPRASADTSPASETAAKIKATKTDAAKSGAVARAAKSGSVAPLPDPPLPRSLAPQLARLVDEAPSGSGWVSEVKYDGYRLLTRREADLVQLLTRNGLDWTERLTPIAEAVSRLPARQFVLDGELVVFDPHGRTSFALLQAALSGQSKLRRGTQKLRYVIFDLLFLDGVDLRDQPLGERKRALDALLEDATAGKSPLQPSGHLRSDASQVRDKACEFGLEGIVCKRLDAPYRSGRGSDWVKVKCHDREEFAVLGWTNPKSNRNGFGALLLGYRDADGGWYAAGGCGTGFDTAIRRDLRGRLDAIERPHPPAGLRVTGALPKDLHWVRPDLVVEVQHAGWTGQGQLRQSAFLGLREDKPATEVTRDPPPSDEPPHPLRTPGKGKGVIVHADKPRPRSAGSVVTIVGERLTHPERAFWPGITKADLARYWEAVAGVALPGIARRPLALVRCPDGIGGEHFFQKHAGKGQPAAVTEGAFDGAPYLEIADAAGLVTCAQIGAIELHSWGSTVTDAGRPDRLVFDLDPGPGVQMEAIADAAKLLRKRLAILKLEAFCRTSGGKGLHVVTPLTPQANWNDARAWCRAFAEALAKEFPDRFVAATRKDIRAGRILIDWLRNGLGSTAIASFSPRARPGAPVAMPVEWRAVSGKLDPLAFNLRTVPARVARTWRDPWKNFEGAAAPLPKDNS